VVFKDQAEIVAESPPRVRNAVALAPRRAVSEEFTQRGVCDLELLVVLSVKPRIDRGLLSGITSVVNDAQPQQLNFKAFDKQVERAARWM